MYVCFERKKLIIKHGNNIEFKSFCLSNIRVYLVFSFWNKSDVSKQVNSIIRDKTIYHTRYKYKYTIQYTYIYIL